MPTRPEPLPPLDPQSIALLGFIHRHTNGGPPAPPRHSPIFADSYAVLIALKFIEHSATRNIWVLSEDGNQWLRQRYADE